MRVEYGSVEKDGSGDLDADWLADGWVALLRKWLADAERAGVAEPNAMVVGTVDRLGRPVTRTVLCKSVDETGISFYTNYDSAKGEELAASPYASATFPWFLLGRQVHVRGPVTKVSAEATADYWSKRPRGSQLGAWASHQSRPIASRAALLQQLADVTQRFADYEAVPVPPNWGGYLIAPEVVEFWQGRENRVHNRIRVTRGPRRAAPAVVRKFFADTTPLRTPDFRRLWLAGIVTVIGGNLTIFAVPGPALRPHPELRLCRAFGVFALVPLIVFGLWGGAWADAMDRRLLLIIASCGLAVASVMLWLQAALALNNVWVVLCLLSVQQAFYRDQQPDPGGGHTPHAARRPAARRQLAEHDGMQFGAIVGPLLAGVMLRWVDLSTLYLIDAITCTLPIWATFRLAPMPPTNGNQGSRDGAHCGARRLPLLGGQPGGADVVRRRPDRDDLRHAPRAVPTNGA